jgi:hypothetical protein
MAMDIYHLFLEFTEKETKSQAKRLKFVGFKKARLLENLSILPP